MRYIIKYTNKNNIDKSISNLHLISSIIYQQKPNTNKYYKEDVVLSIILDDKLATDGIEYSYRYLLEGIYQPNKKTTESWKVVDVRSLHDNDSNSLEDYQRYIDLTYKAIIEHGKAVICCSYGISRSNAIALGVLVKYYGLTFVQALVTIKQKVDKSDIAEAHISKLKELLIKD